MNVRLKIIEENLEKIKNLRMANKVHMKALVKDYGSCPLCRNPHYPHCTKEKE